MTSIDKTKITVETTIQATIDMVWKCWTTPEEIVHWYYASVDWHAPRAENDLKTGGKFLTRMEAKDGSFGFDFFGTYTWVDPEKRIEILLGDDRTMSVDFSVEGNTTTVTEIFEAENTNTVELQRAGWQAILNNFKAYVESK